MNQPGGGKPFWKLDITTLLLRARLKDSRGNQEGRILLNEAVAIRVKSVVFEDQETENSGNKYAVPNWTSVLSRPIRTFRRLRPIVVPGLWATLKFGPSLRWYMEVKKVSWPYPCLVREVYIRDSWLSYWLGFGSSVFKMCFTVSLILSLRAFVNENLSNF